jgi:hypothetical protein
MTNKLSDEVMTKIGKAVTILYNLDLKLSNSYTGNRKNSMDKAINKLRRSLRRSLNNLRSPNWIGELKHLL